MIWGWFIFLIFVSILLFVGYLMMFGDWDNEE